MKAILFTSLCLLIFPYCFCQNNKDGIELPEIKTNAIALGIPEHTSSTVKPIKSLLVIDARFDTTSLGLYQTIPGKYFSAVAATNTVDEITGFLKNYLEIEKKRNNGSRTIIMVIRKLWLTNELQQELPIENRNNIKGRPDGGVIAKFEFYCSKGNGYTPLYRFDTIYTGLKSIRYDAEENLRDVLIMSVKPLMETDLNELSSARKEMSLHEIDLYSKQQFDIPVIQTNTYKKGVYQTFDEFKMNHPSITTYSIEDDKLTKTIFFKDDQGEHPIRDVWGYCDGNHLYIKSGDNYFELVKKQHTFISIASRPLKRRRDFKAGNVLLFGSVMGTVGKGNKKVSYNLYIKPYELDMDTGELY